MDDEKYAVIDNEVCRFSHFNVGGGCFGVSPTACIKVCQKKAVIEVGRSQLKIVKVYCNGCGACEEVCLANAIKMEVREDE